MKRSEINRALKELEAMCIQEHCYLPPFCHFTPEDWKTKGHEYLIGICPFLLGCFIVCSNLL